MRHLSPGWPVLLIVWVALAFQPLAASAIESRGAPAPPAAPRTTDGATVWTEVPVLVPIKLGDARLEKLTIQAEADVNGAISVVSTYLLGNTTPRAIPIKLAVPLGYYAAIDILGAEVRAAPGMRPTKVELGAPPVAQPVDTLERTSLPVRSAYAQPVDALVLPISVDGYAAVELKVTHRIAWTPVLPARHFPTEKAFSVGLVGVGEWGGALQQVDVDVRFSPRLLGPASMATPGGYRYDSRGLAWSFVRGEDSALTLPERIVVSVFADYPRRSFEGAFFARFEVPVEEVWPWAHRFYYADPFILTDDGGRAVTAEALSELLKKLEDVELGILARNGKPFDDTFLLMRFQKEPWYRPKPDFSEDRLRPIEKWNIGYVRCFARAVRTVLSALEKKGIPGMTRRDGRRFDMLVQAFTRCDKRFWNPKPVDRGPKSLRLD